MTNVRTPGDGWQALPLSEGHVEHLSKAAITPDVARAAGIHSITELDQLPEWARDYGRAAFGIGFPWRSPDGEVVVQIRPDIPIGADEQKYLWPAGQSSILNTVREVTDDTETVFLVEGTKQGWAVAGYAPDNVAIYAFGGCRNWSTDGLPINDLMVVEGKQVVILLDADTKTNRAVYDAGVELARACQGESCAGEPRFVWMPGAKTTGIDDLLGKRAEDKRAPFLAQLVNLALSSTGRDKQTRPAAKRPDARKEEVVLPTGSSDRPIIYLDGDRLELVNDITAVLLAKYNATRLFCHGERLSQLKGQEMKPVDEGTFNLILAQAARTVFPIIQGGERVGVKDQWPDTTSVRVVLSRADEFAELDLVARSPFVRANGSVCAVNGYDADTRTMVVMDPELVGIEVPEHPTADEITQARKLILDDWLGDFPFPDEANRANALALVITPFVRSMMYVAPLAVVDGLAPGVGKNLLVDCILTMFLGDKPEMMGWNPNDDEMRKTITSAFMAGPEVMVFDEAHRLDGPSLARALTAAYWKDRLLGGNSIKGYPNRATWIALGNNVRIEGDIFRRVFQIALRPTEANPENRPTSDFRHPQLEDWTREHRADLVKAALTLVRAWFAAGKPRPVDGVTFGSFEKWAEIVGGIVATAGQPDFLGNLTAWRSESNLDAGHWATHLAWLAEKFGDDEFTCRQVREKLTTDVLGAEYPPLRNADVDNKATYPKALGEAYHAIRDRSFGGHRIVRPLGLDGKPKEARGGRALWRVVPDGPIGPKGGNEAVQREGMEGPEDAVSLSPTGNDIHTLAREDESVIVARKGGSVRATSTPSGPSLPPPVADEAPKDYARLAPADFAAPATESISGEVLVFDIEGGSAEQVFTAGPKFVRIFGYQTGDQLRVTESAREMVELLRTSRLVVGHNIMNLDLIPFALHHGLDIHQAAEDGRFWDTQLVEVLLNPPPFYMKPRQVPAEYSLDKLALDKFKVGKSHDLKGLVKKHGGKVMPKGKWGSQYDVIPTDDEEYVQYCAADVDLTTRIARTQRATPAQVDYIRREHRIAAIATQIQMNGFLVDQDLLHERIAQGHARKAELRERLLDLGATFVKKDGTPAKVLTDDDKLVIEGVFNELGVELPRSPSGQGPSLRKETIEELAQQHQGRPEVVELLSVVGQFNGVRTVYQTALDNLHPDGRVHPNINMYQSTGRWSVQNPGMTVFGKRGGRHVEREIFVADEGQVIIAADLSQVDARAISAWSQCPDYMRMFEPGMDLHAEVAFQMFGDRGRRDDAKALSHGYNYGLGYNKLAKAHGPDLARAFLDTMEQQFPRLVAWKDEIRRESIENGFRLDNGWGKPLVVDPASNHTQAPALVGQSAARDIMMQGLLNLPRWILPMLRVQVHDEIVLSVPEDRVDEIKAIVVDCLSFPWRPFNGERGHERPVQILADSGKHGVNWGSIYSK